jgi:hypothetical protein
LPFNFQKKQQRAQPIVKTEKGVIRIRKTPFYYVAGATRLELATSGVTGRRSNQLNYTPENF